MSLSVHERAVVNTMPRPAVDEPRAPLLQAVLRFTRAARDCAGVSRVALLGSLTTQKRLPKDADVLVVVSNSVDLAPLARAGRRLKGFAQGLNLGADVFLADEAARYVGRICHWRECRPRVACQALHCGRRQHLSDDLQIVTLQPELISDPPVELWPQIIRRICVPADVEEELLARLEKNSAREKGRV